LPLEATAPRFQKYIFVCEHSRDNGEACCSSAGTRLRERLKAMVKEKKLDAKIRVSRSGCLDVCSEGPNVLVMPDNVWYKRVAESDLAQILEKACRPIG
jgi:(2Fe-2S) ferredoxin